MSDAPLGTRRALPAHGATRAEIDARFDAIAADDLTDWEERLMAGGTYPAGDEVLQVALEGRPARRQAVLATLRASS